MASVRPTSSATAPAASFPYPTTRRTNLCSWLTSAVSSLWNKVMGTSAEASTPKKLPVERVAHHRPMRRHRGPSLCAKLALAALTASSGAAAVDQRNVVIISGNDYPLGSPLARMADRSAAQWEALVAKNPNFGHLRYKGDPTHEEFAKIQITYTGKKDLVDLPNMTDDYLFPIHSPKWGRYSVIARIFDTSPKVDVVCYADADVVPMNIDAPLPLPEGEEFAMFPEDLSVPTTVNSGYFCVTRDSTPVLATHRQLYSSDFIHRDQEAMSALLKANPHLLRYFRIIGHERTTDQGALMGYVTPQNHLSNMTPLRCNSKLDTVCHCIAEEEYKPDCVDRLIAASQRRETPPTQGKITRVVYQINSNTRFDITAAREKAFARYREAHATELLPFYSASSWGLFTRLQELFDSTEEDPSSWVAAFDGLSFPLGDLEKLIEKTDSTANFIAFLDNRAINTTDETLTVYAEDSVVLARNSKESRDLLKRMTGHHLSVCEYLYGTDCKALSPFCSKSFTPAQLLSWEIVTDPALAVELLPTSYFDKDAHLVLAKVPIFSPTQKPKKAIVATFQGNRSHPKS